MNEKRYLSLQNHREYNWTINQRIVDLNINYHYGNQIY